MLWTDVNEIAIELYVKHSDLDPRYILFTDLHILVLSLDGVNDGPNKRNENIFAKICNVFFLLL